jgi:hypothetical protein
MAQTSRQYIQRLQIIHGAQITMIIVFNLIAFVSRPPMVAGQEIFLYVFAAVLIFSVLASRMIFKNFIVKASAAPTLSEKLTKYLTAYIVRMAFLEVPGFFAAVVVLITGNVMALLGTAGVLILFFLLRPSVDLLKQELDFSQEQRAKIENPDGMVME